MLNHKRPHCIAALLTYFAWVSVLPAQQLDLPQCRSAFGLSPAHTWPPLTPQNTVVIPDLARASEQLTVCTVDFVYPDHVSVSRSGNRITYTIYDSGISWGPNPPIAIAQPFGPLPPGSYLLDAVIEASWTPHPDIYPVTIAHDVPFAIAANNQEIPAASPDMLILLAATLGIGGAATLASRRYGQ